MCVANCCVCFRSCFELFIATKSHFTVQAIFAPGGQAALIALYCEGGVCAVHKAFKKVTTTTAKATEPSDAKAIKAIIHQLPQQFRTLDNIIQEKLSALIIRTLAKEDPAIESGNIEFLELEIERLLAILNEREAKMEEQQQVIDALKLNQQPKGASSGRRAVTPAAAAAASAAARAVRRARNNARGARPFPRGRVTVSRTR